MRILGLDLSLTSTGYCLLDEDSVAVFAAGAYDVPLAMIAADRMRVVWHGSVGSSTLRDVERLRMFDEWIRGFINDNPLSARLEHVAIEGYSYGSPAGQTRAFGLGELGGVIKLAIHQAGIPMHIIAANTWKKVLCGKGGLKKDLVRLELFKRYGVEFASQDTLDAWAVAMCLRRQLLGLDKPEPKSRKKRAVSSGKSDTLSLIPAMEAVHADDQNARLC
jgi:Holliday junction resolvasome RuvABC endonuclease subunit